jgi:flagellar assembly factor FliW/2-polyprenyl-3-methyl-5-hydroxy-6-metoxy-1,4-benzoquinol methylase
MNSQQRQDAKRVIRLPFGLLGFEEVKNYLLLPNSADDRLLSLQMLEGAKRSFLVIPPGLVLPDYQPEISNQDAEVLGLTDATDAVVLNIVTQRESATTVNLKGPIVINRHTLIGKQIIPENASKFGLRHPMNGFRKTARNAGESPVQPAALHARPAPKSVAYSCVVDQDPTLAAQCFIWVNCLLEIQQVPPENIFVHHPDIANADFAAWLKSRRVNLVKIKPFDARSPHCNKLQQLKTFIKGEFDRVILMDCDTAWVGNAPFPSVGPAAGKIVTNANPPESILARIFHEAGVGEPNWVPVTFQRGPDLQFSDRNNLNGGLYVLAGSLVPQIDAAWRRWADWCLDHRHLFGSYGIHVDQVSFALALRELGIWADLLPNEWNFSIHVPAAELSDLTPQIIHYHRQIGAHFKIKLVGLPKPDQAISALNERIEGFLGRHFVNSVFWDLRYRIDPNLGSGVGSRGDCLVDKRQWLEYALETFANKKVVDIGCGDLEVIRTLPLKNYVGLDVSQEALALARPKRPDWRFTHIAADEPALLKGDAVVCLDVLIHQRREDEFNALIQRLANAAGERLIVSGFNEPQSSAGICSFHRPIVAALEETGLFSEISVIGKYRDLSLVVADKRRAGFAAHPNDMSAADFNEASRLSKRADLLRLLADLSRETFGFYTRHFPRTIEYPWVAEKLEWLRPGQRVLDLGAGLNPLPLFLARRGIRVDTLDSHPVKRVPPADSTWNEWGFYDYAQVHSNLRSHQLDAAAFEPDSPLDVVYSVSVIEHMPRATWEAVLGRCRSWLAGNGRLLLTIDLIPGTDSLWNYSEGQVVEPVEVHGNVTDFVNCLRSLGFRVTETFTQRQVPKSRTDLLFIDCVVN